MKAEMRVEQRAGGGAEGSFASERGTNDEVRQEGVGFQLARHRLLYMKALGRWMELK